MHAEPPLRRMQNTANNKAPIQLLIEHGDEDALNYSCLMQITPPALVEVKVDEGSHNVR